MSIRPCSSRTERLNLSVVHADPAWVVVDKPAGLPSVPGRAPGLQDCAASRAQALYPDALVVHRLDMATSGLLLLARGVDRQRLLSRAFAERRVQKCYEAVVHGALPGDSGQIDLPLAADWPNRPRQQVDHVRGKPSLTHWRVLLRAEGRTRVELTPVTGRSHQLRVHLAAIGHPIVGDRLYADDTPPASERLLLHATRLALHHPDTGAPARFCSAAPF